MSHSKHDISFLGGTLRQLTNIKKGISTAECKLIDPNTACPYTNAELYQALLRRSDERPALAAAVEHEIHEIAKKAKRNPDAEFRLQCSGKTRADVDNKAKKELYPRLGSLPNCFIVQYGKALLQRGALLLRILWSTWVMICSAPPHQVIGLISCRR